MTSFSQLILSDWQVRKTKKQKLAFIRLMQSHFPALRVEESKIIHNRNLVAGDLETAEFILSAHYDTCAVLLFPNFIMLKNILITVLGLYLDRIRTGRDRIFDERNIEYLCKSTIDFLVSAEGGK